jgi:hypothetical protein
MTSITSEEYHQHRGDYDGLCLSCRAWTYGDTDPDTEGGVCDNCGESSVCGTEQALILGELDITSDEE